VPFSLVSFFWASKRKKLASGARPASNSLAAEGSFLFERTSAMKML
jgi:hypothetical protein